MLTDSRWLTYQVWFWLSVQWWDVFHLGEVVNKRRCRFERAGLVRLRLVGTDWERFCIWCVWEQEISVGSGSVPSAACRDHPNPRQAFWQRALHVSGATAGWWRGDEEGRVRRSSQLQHRPVPEQERGWKDRKQLPRRLSVWTQRSSQPALWKTN